MEFNKLLVFLTNLKSNNNKAWFDEHKKEYDILRKQWLAYVQETIQAVGVFDGDVLTLEPKNCIFRINRDVRFSNDKSPYKTNFGLSLSKVGNKNEFCGYYLHVEPGKSFLAGGVYMPMPDKLAAIRQEIDYNADEFTAIVSHKTFKKNFTKLTGETLKRPPKGYEPTNPMIDFIKQKSFIAEYKLTDADLLKKDFTKQVAEVFKTMQPLNEFLCRAIKQL